MKDLRKISAKKTVLIYNYYDGILVRGVIAQVNNLVFVLEENDVEHKVVRCPAWLRWFPKHGVLFHFMEQFIVPILGLSYDVVIYPYNSASIFAPLHRGSLLVVHDFILHRRKVPGYWKMSAVLVRVTQWFYCLFNGDVAFITPHVERQALFLGRFERARRFLLPNCFRSFEHDASRRGSAIHGDYVLLCSGAVPSKDLRGALTHYRESAALSRHPLVILGLGKARADAREIAIELGIDPGRLTALGLVSQDELIDLYKKAALVWVHSLHEGFGRNLAEAVTCGKSVLASRIPPFKAQARDNRNIFLYENHVAASLEVAADQCAAHVFTPEPVDVSYDVLLRNLEKILN